MWKHWRHARVRGGKRFSGEKGQHDLMVRTDIQSTDRTATLSPAREPRSRGKAPVFVLGCGRSGTTLLYHMLLSSGNFAIYRTESNVINLLEPRFGDLRDRKSTRLNSSHANISYAV